ncbi:MAG: tRNA (adenosine(37)-N6)-dimethylallyltransferase MiaA [Bacilli bacterium]
MSKIIVITGPTAVGKTKLSIELAKKYNGEIINADAVQVYKDLDIGSAKVTEEEKENIPHHLFDIKDVNEEYTIYHYQKDCRKKIKEILDRGNTPILVGGTGLYIKAALYDYKLTEEKETNTYDNLTTEELYNELLELDKDIVIDKNNRRRLIRAINYYKENNKSINNNVTNKLLYDCIFIGLTTDRKVLYDKINTRVDIMMKEGLLNEVKAFYEKGIRTKPLLNAIGYKEIYSYLDGNISLEEAIDKIKQNSRHYAKRQYTFFNHQLPVVWFETDYNNFNNTIEKVENYIKSIEKIK